MTDATTTVQTDPLDPLSSLISGSTSQRYQEQYVSPRSLSTDSSATESPVHEEQGFGGGGGGQQNYGNYFTTPGVHLPSILYTQLYGNQFPNSDSTPEQRAAVESCNVRQEEVRSDSNVWRPY